MISTTQIWTPCLHQQVFDCKPFTSNLERTYQVLLSNQRADTSEVVKEVHDEENLEPKSAEVVYLTPGDKQPFTAVSGVKTYIAIGGERRC